jgi:uncharacterized protein (TIGR03437 family)
MGIRYIARVQDTRNDNATDWDEEVRIDGRPADNGTVCLKGARVRDWQGRVTELDIPNRDPGDPPVCLDMDRSARYFAVASKGSVYWLDSRQGTTRLLEPVPSPATSVRLSADGSVVSYIANGTLIAGGRTYDTPEPVREAALSGDGRSAWAVTVDGRVIRVDLSTQTMTQVIGPVPVIVPPQSLPIGSTVTYRIQGGGMPAALRVRLDGVAQPLRELARTSSSITVQVPWETPPGVRASMVDTQPAPGAPFDLDFHFDRTHQTSAYGPVVLRPAYHADWRGPVTWEDPARPGEWIHLYAVGLGPVDTAIATGQPGPASPPARVKAPYACLEWTHNRTGEWWIGLAPGLIGFYQVSVRMPAEPVPANPDGETTFTCITGGVPPGIPDFSFGVLLRKP